jgi:peptide/nickel transport system permease protein
LWWWYLPPGLAIALCVLALNLISLGIEEQSDPRLKRVLRRGCNGRVVDAAFPPGRRAPQRIADCPAPNRQTTRVSDRSI